MRSGAVRSDVTGLPVCGSRAQLGVLSAGAFAYCEHEPGGQSNVGESVPAWVAWEGTVPLSEHEQRQLEQIEQALRGGDPQFADALQAADPRVRYRRWLTAAVLGFLAGVGLLLAGVVIKIILIAVAGFVVMLACSLWAVTSYQRMTGVTTGRVTARAGIPGKRRAAKARRHGNQGGSGQMRWLEERWRRRQERGR
jgi:Protein of unknown function (DUF3040)